jgi:hypothetical protein
MVTGNHTSSNCMSYPKWNLTEWLLHVCQQPSVVAEYSIETKHGQHRNHSQHPDLPCLHYHMKLL